MYGSSYSPVPPSSNANGPYKTYAAKKVNIKTIDHNILHLFMQQVLIILETDGYTEGGSAR